MLMLDRVIWWLLGVFTLSWTICAADSEARKTEATNILSTATCPSASLNYITHTLPQQCLKSGYTTSVPSSITPVFISSSPPTTSVSETVSSSNTSTIVSSPAETSESRSNLTTTSHDVTTPATSTSTEADPSTSSATPILPLPMAETDSEIDSPLDTAKFLSFEDWKKQNLAQAGQSPEHLSARANTAQAQDRRRPDNNNGLDSFGEEAEIDIDFGFGSPSTRSGAQTSTGESSQAVSTSSPTDTSTSSPHLRSKDAGKTCKERFNYASFDCAATILKTNPRSKSVNSVLVENKDSYMLNECSIPNKFLIVELCDDILVDTVVLANFEFFSSMFRTFRISVSDRYPVKAEKWKELGTFEARNSRDIQAFLVENPLIWARYLRVEFLTHFGSEYYCPVSLLRVHGTTMMEEFRHQEQLARGELDDEDEEEEEVGEVGVVSTELVPISVATASIIEGDKSSMPSPASSSTADSSSVVSSSTISTTPLAASTVSIETLPAETTATVEHDAALNRTVENDSRLSTSAHASTTVIASSSSLPVSSSTNATTSMTSSSLAESPAASIPVSTSIANVNTTISNSTSPPPHSSKATQNSTSATSSSTISTSTPPATQESFFRSIQKRLTALEANATLSLQYIESQSSLLRDAFASASKRQLSRTTSFLDALNVSISNELKGFKSEYDQLWQSTVLELAAQREEGRREREVLAEHVRMLAEEVVSQKRIVAVQAGLMLLCVGAVVFGQLGGVGTVLGGFAGSTLQSPGGAEYKSRVRSGKQQQGGVYPLSPQPESPTGDDSADNASASAPTSAMASRNWRQRWRWDSPFRSSVGPGAGISSNEGSAVKSRTPKLKSLPLPAERRVRSDGMLVQRRVRALQLENEQEDGAEQEEHVDDGRVGDDTHDLSASRPQSGAGPSGTGTGTGTESASEGDAEGSGSGSGAQSRAESPHSHPSSHSPASPTINTNTNANVAANGYLDIPPPTSASAADGELVSPISAGSEVEQQAETILMQVRSAPATPLPL